jgi:sulfotransferase
VDNGIHFISGLPRAGSTLLAALLRQNPSIHAAAISPVARLVSGLMRDMSGKNPTAMFVSDEQRLRVLKSCIEGFYAHIHPDQVVFDTDLGWPAKLPVLARTYPKAKVICCVRSPAFVLDSLERLARGSALGPSGLIAFDAEDTVYARAETLMAPRGLVGYPLAALKGAICDERCERLMLLRYETLTATPAKALAEIYAFIGQPSFEHDPRHIEPDLDALDFDDRAGVNGLHALPQLGCGVPPRTVLPADLVSKYHADAFWERPNAMPSTVRLL